MQRYFQERQQDPEFNVIGIQNAQCEEEQKDENSNNDDFEALRNHDREMKQLVVIHSKED